MSMLLRNLDPFKEFREMEQRFQSLFPSTEKAQTNVAGFSPSVNTREGDYAYHIEVDLPGVKKEDIKVEVKDNRVTISGERKTKEEVKEEEYYRVESSYGKFERSFTLPENVDSENVTASSNDGVLEVVLPKKERNGSAKQVEVK
ncbi:Hsp20/alpha crystallin family protein [Thiomicrorhabdus sp. ZW0627]|uniref:Hsp20/alpha crystallin family protein n=1 Tax=Thiomicrorhabdus sp. ZW0627 TaxID=3039774 RepID=UPI0024363AF6|nr:Hsp20/alpha crystallin family protein [Thiomicrorhabdus sp. ZW0627]MDG6774250.1 Hsp20/alpha crystallin family protein [Thiomicrorhabdus sp. ZW0627]